MIHRSVLCLLWLGMWALERYTYFLNVCILPELLYNLLQSTLLQCLLKELSPMSGSVDVNGSVSYASQEPWVFSSSLRENVLFGQNYDPIWYNTVIEACALDKVVAYNQYLSKH